MSTTYEPPIELMNSLFWKYAKTGRFVQLKGVEAIGSDGKGFFPRIEVNVTVSQVCRLSELEDLAKIARGVGLEPMLSVRGEVVILFIDPSRSGQAAAKQRSYIFDAFDEDDDDIDNEG